MTMKDKLVNRIVFWMLAIIPFLSLFLILNVFGGYWFVTFLLIYTLIYRPLLHIFRLLSLQKIEEKDAWKLFIPFYHNRFFRSMWFE